MKYKGIIFDLDGVICSTDEYHYRAWKALADKLGISFDRERNNLLRGVSRMASLDILLGDRRDVYSDRAKQEMAEEKNDLYRQMLGQMSPLDLEKEVRKTLFRIRKSGMRMAIGSSSKNTPYILDRIGLEEFFDAVSDGNNITRSKPDPEVFLKGAAFLGLSPSVCAVVEDAVAGIDAANAGGFLSIGLGDAANYEKTDRRISSLSEILLMEYF